MGESSRFFELQVAPFPPVSPVSLDQASAIVAEALMNNAGEVDPCSTETYQAAGKTSSAYQSFDGLQVWNKPGLSGLSGLSRLFG